VTISHFEANLDQLVINGQLVTVAALNSTPAGDTSTASDGSQAASLGLLGQVMASSFVSAGDGNGMTPLIDQPSNLQPMLALPHA
jgi:hypothetical protein